MTVHLLKNYGMLATSTLCGIPIPAMFELGTDADSTRWSYWGAETCEECRKVAHARLIASAREAAR